MAGQHVFLLIDDDEDDRELFAEVLQEVDASANLQTAANGSDALDLLTRADTVLPQLIFLDLNMPRMSGKECLRRLKAHPGLNQIPVLVYTTSTLAADRTETLAAGAAGYLPKPTDIQVLKRTLAAIVQSNFTSVEQTIRDLGLANGAGREGDGPAH